MLKKIKLLDIIPSSPFAFDSTFHKPDHFASNDNFWEPGVRWQTFRWPSSAKASFDAKMIEDKSEGKLLGVKFEDKGTVEKPKILLSVYSSEKLSEDFIDSLVTEVKYRYNLDLDLSDFYSRFKDDKILKPIIKKWRGMRPGHQSSLYEYLIIGIVLQNATVRRSIQMYQALLQNYGTLLEFDDKKLWCIWNAGELEKVSEEKLRSLKVGYRAKSIKKIDDYFSRGEIYEFELREKNFETQKAELLKLYGVGPATVWYLLFDVFHHFDFFEHISPWEQKIYSKLFFDNDHEKNPIPVPKIIAYFERFGKYKQLAVHYLWEDLWWKRKNENIPWLEKLIRV